MEALKTHVFPISPSAYHVPYITQCIPCSLYHPVHTMFPISPSAYHVPYITQCIPCSLYHPVHTMFPISPSAYHVPYITQCIPCSLYHPVHTMFPISPSAYHGHTVPLMGLSSYKAHQVTTSGSYSENPHAWVVSYQSGGLILHVLCSQVPCPDAYQGLYRDPSTAGQQYADEVKKTIDEIKGKGKKVYC